MHRREPPFATIVQDGSVSPVILNRGTLGVVGPGGAAQVTQATVDGNLAWAQGHLTFTDARMADVVPDLSSWFDFDVHLCNPKLADDRLTVTLNDLPGDVALDIIARAVDARVVRIRRPVTLYARLRVKVPANGLRLSTHA